MAARKQRGPTTRRKKKVEATQKLLDITVRLRTAPCVPALRDAVGAWRTGGYNGATDTTRRLLAHWFESDHRLADGTPFQYHECQREAVETVLFLWEVRGIRSRVELINQFSALQGFEDSVSYDSFARFCIKMATGTGKTKVIALLIAWQFLNAQREVPRVASQYSKSFLIIAPNLIVLERLKTDFSGGRIFRVDPLVPREFSIFWDFDCIMREDGVRAHSAGALFVTNVQQFYPARATSREPAVMTDVLGAAPGRDLNSAVDFREAIRARRERLMVLNDEAHHTHDEQNLWNQFIRALNEETQLAAQLDFSATPRFESGELFPWTVYDYPLKQAIVDGAVNPNPTFVKSV